MAVPTRPAVEQATTGALRPPAAVAPEPTRLNPFASLAPSVAAGVISLLHYSAGAPAFAPPRTGDRPAPDPRGSAREPEVRRSKLSPAGHGSGGHGPGLPLGPPTGAGLAGSGASSAGGASAALWCVILLGFLAYPARELRRHRFWLVLLGPVGFDLLQQRPG
jgi:hypothetical protein